MSSQNVPTPTVMPVDRAKWRAELHRSNFVNMSAQFEDVQSLGNVRTILIVGPGQGLDTAMFRWRGYAVTTFDIDDTMEPDVIGSVHDLSMFSDAQFDVVIASHVIEHMAVPYLDRALGELARVARHALIYLPVYGRQMQLRFIPGVRNLDLSFVFDVFNFMDKPDGLTPRYSAGQHFWGLGMPVFRRRDVLRRLAQSFEVIRHYRNADWTVSHNFVLRSRRHQT